MTKTKKPVKNLTPEEFLKILTREVGDEEVERIIESTTDESPLDAIERVMWVLGRHLTKHFEGINVVTTEVSPLRAKYSNNIALSELENIVKKAVDNGSKAEGSKSKIVRIDAVRVGESHFTLQFAYTMNSVDLNAIVSKKERYDTSDTDRIDWMIFNEVDIEAPDGENQSWLVYTKSDA